MLDLWWINVFLDRHIVLARVGSIDAISHDLPTWYLHCSNVVGFCFLLKTIISFSSPGLVYPCTHTSFSFCVWVDTSFPAKLVAWPPTQKGLPFSDGALDGGHGLSNQTKPASFLSKVSIYNATKREMWEGEGTTKSKTLLFYLYRSSNLLIFAIFKAFTPSAQFYDSCNWNI